jgi:hypothetical protein
MPTIDGLGKSYGANGHSDQWVDHFPGSNELHREPFFLRDPDDNTH